MIKEIKSFLTALLFLTRIPCNSLIVDAEKYFDKSTKYFPLVGIIIGSFATIIYYLCHLILPNNVSILISIIATIILTGALHEDGFADCCDGFGSNSNKEKILSVMKDSYLGSYGTLGLILIITLKYITLCNISSTMIPYVLIAGHSISRFFSVSFFYTHNYIRTNDNTSKSSILANKMNHFDFFISFFFAILTILLLGYNYLLVFIILIVIKELIGYYFKRKLDGYTGDCLGAVQQITEVLFYILVLTDLWKYI